MSGMGVEGGTKKANMRAVVLNADGSIKADLGMVGYYHRNPILRFFGSKLVGWLSAYRIRQYNRLARSTK